MPDTAQVTTVYESPKHLIVTMTNESDGTGESGVVKVDKSAKTGPNGSEPSKFKVMEINWNVQGFNYVTLDFDRGTDVEIDVLSGSGYKSYEAFGGLVDDGSGGTGDVILTTDGGADGSTYTITMFLVKKD